MRQWMEYRVVRICTEKARKVVNEDFGPLGYVDTIMDEISLK